MSWLTPYDVVLLDLDGLLVTTEELHFAAYRAMCQARGCTLSWTMNDFFSAAHFSATGLRDALYAAFPQLKEQEPKWSVLYEEKRRAYLKILQEQPVGLMPGVDTLLRGLQEAGIPKAVVTNSPQEQVALIRVKQPLLDTVPLWLTREGYANGKPAPDGYIAALEKLGKSGARAIGFEDSLRGVEALIGAGVRYPTLIAPSDHPQMVSGIPQGVRYFTSFPEFFLGGHTQRA
jgi:HAD superfamily hydrolase (TIGR01509 family)